MARNGAVLLGGEPLFRRFGIPLDYRQVGARPPLLTAADRNGMRLKSRPLARFPRRRVFGSWCIIIKMKSTMKAVQEKFIIDSKGKKTGVILSLRRYRKLREDLHDMAVVAERRSEPTISFEEMKRRLKKNGHL